MNVKEFFNVANEIAPKTLSDEYCEKYGAYDNSGVLINTGAEIVGVLFSLDFSDVAIEKAKMLGANLIVTHHPAIYGKIGDICVSETDPLKGKLIKCLQSGISVISMHLNLDCAMGGIDESFAQGIVCSIHKTDGACMRSMQEKTSIMHPLTAGGYGRAYDVPTTDLQTLIKGVEKEFCAKRVTTYGDMDRKISRVASFCGGGADEQSIAFAVQEKADVVLSSDFKHHIITMAVECGLAVVSLTHYATEHYGFEKYYQKICQRVDVPCAYCKEESYL